MDKRFALALGLSVAIFVGWSYFFPPPKAPPRPAAPAPSAPATPAAAAGAAAATPTATAPAGAPAAAAPAGAAPGAPAPAGAAPPGAQPAPAPVRPPEQLISVEESGYYKAVISTWGGAFKSFELTSPRFVSGKDKKPINLAETFQQQGMLGTELAGGDFKLPVDAAFVEDATAPKNEKRLVYETDEMKLTKSFVFSEGSYEVRLKVRLESKLDRGTKHALQVDLPGYHDPAQKAGGFFQPSVIVTEGACRVDGKVERNPYEKIVKESISKTGAVQWAAIDRKFFVAALANIPQASDAPGRCTVVATATGAMLAQMTLPERALPPKGVAEYELAGFFGPKMVKELDKVELAGVAVKLGDVMNYGLTEFIARPLLATLRAIYTVAPNWGLAVILLTILVKAALWWPTQKSMESMKAVAKLKPEVDKLKARFGDDKNGFNMAVMELYRKEGVNPAGGCLPMLVQIPIFIGLFSMLGSSVELYHAPFVGGWITDLTSPDPYYILPGILGGLIYLQQRTAPAPPDPQQKTMMIGMQAAFVFASVFWPAGLTLYSLTNTVTSIAQQWYTNHKNKTADGDKAKTTDDGEPRPESKAEKRAKAAKAKNA